MQHFANHFLRKCLLALGVFWVLAAADAASAASIKFEVRVPGFTGRGNGWVLIPAEARPPTAGAVSWDSARGCYVTDRVSSGEEFRVTIAPTVPGERCLQWSVVIGSEPSYGTNPIVDVLLPLGIQRTVPRTVRGGFVIVRATTTRGTIERRVPIGSR